VVPHCGGVLVIDDPLSLLSLGIWLFAAGMWPVGFLFGACSACCQQECPWLLEFQRCMRVERVGADPPAGGHCLVSSFSSNTGDIQRVTARFGSSSQLEIYNAQSRISIPVRLSLPASESSRTPVGETRTQVWRFNRPEPRGAEHNGLGPAADAYDILGPAWHLQVDLSVTGVETQEEESVVSSVGQDSEGQPKLILQVNQWTRLITHEESITLFPVGLQRLEANSVTFRMQAAPRDATLASGDSYPLWQISKPSGMTIEERALAINIRGTSSSPGQFNSACTGGALASPRVILDEQTAAEFLSGDAEVVVSMNSVSGDANNAGTSAGPIGPRSLRVLPQNDLCGIHFSSLDLGVALGIYPEKVYATPSQAFIDDKVNGKGERGAYCDKTPWVMRNIGGSRFWASDFNYRGVGLTWSLANGLRPSNGPVQIGVEHFYSGASLLWNAENGPFRTAGQGSGPIVVNLSTGPGWTYSLDGEGDEFFNKRDKGVCPQGMSVQLSGDTPGNRYNVCTPPEVSIQGTYEFTYRPGPANPPQDPVTVNGSMQGTLLRNSDLTGFTSASGLPSIRHTGTITGQSHSVVNFFGFPENFTPTLNIEFATPVPCEVSGEAPGAVTATTIMNLSDTSIVVLGVSSDVSFSVPFASRVRPSCSEWSPSPAPAEGAIVSRSCEGFEDYIVSPFGSVVDSFTLTPHPSTLPRGFGYNVASRSDIANRNVFYGPGPLQAASTCKLLGIRDIRGDFTLSPDSGREQATIVVLFNVTSGRCFFFLPVFGSEDFPPLAAIPSTRPCGNCASTVSVVSGDENASVEYISQGDKAGIIEVIAKRAWLGGQGVTFTISCGGDTITQVIRRANLPPTPPRNLTAARGPCSDALLQWEAPEHDGGQPISGYRVQFRRIGTFSWTTFATVSPTTFSATITGLARVGYEFRTLAVNSVGDSAQSNIVVDGFSLGPPTSLAFTRDPCNQVQLSWTPPVQAGCVVIANYRLEYRVGVSGTFLVFGTVASTATTGTITGLDPALLYQFRVASIDEANAAFMSSIVTAPECN
jgi:hypothetical protein